MEIREIIELNDADLDLVSAGQRQNAGAAQAGLINAAVLVQVQDVLNNADILNNNDVAVAILSDDTSA